MIHVVNGTVFITACYSLFLAVISSAAATNDESARVNFQ